MNAILSGTADEILDIKPLLTMVGGKAVYDAMRCHARKKSERRELLRMSANRQNCRKSGDGSEEQ